MDGFDKSFMTLLKLLKDILSEDMNFRIVCTTPRKSCALWIWIQKDNVCPNNCIL